MVDLEEQIKELNNILDETITEVDKLTQEIKNLKNKSQDLDKREEEIKVLNSKLITCQTERDNIREQVGVKIEELKQSNLSQEQKAQEISKLMTGEYQKLKEAC